MDNKTKNMKLLWWTIGICIAGVVYIGAFVFHNFDNEHYRDWLIMVIGLIGALSGGILTMVGVILTLNRNIDDVIRKEKNEELLKLKSLNTTRIKVKNEIEAYLDSIKQFSLEMTKLRVEKSHLNEDDFENQCNDWIYFDTIYFMSDNLKDEFYEIAIYNENEEIIKSFIELMQNHDRVKRKYLSNASKTNSLHQNMILETVSKDYMDFKINVFTSCVYGHKLDFSKIEEMLDNIKKFRMENIYSKGINDILKFLCMELELKNSY